MKQQKPDNKHPRFTQELIVGCVDQKIANDEVIKIFIPIAIKRRGGSAMVILPKNIKTEELNKSFDEKLIRAFAKAQKWKVMLENGDRVKSLADIAIMEKITTPYVSRVFNLNFIAPEIVERILNGTQPRSLKLQDMLIGKIPDVWEEQKELWGF